MQTLSYFVRSVSKYPQDTLENFHQEEKVWDMVAMVEIPAVEK